MNPLSKTPFLYVLLPLLLGILLQYYLQIDKWSIVFFLFGGSIMLYSFLIPPTREYGLRWLFGGGLVIFVAGLGVVSTSFSQHQTEFDYSEKKDVYKGVVISEAKNKARTLAYDVSLPDLDKKIICYVSRDTLVNKQLQIGDIFLFEGKIVPFQNFRKDTKFDYVDYMHRKGFAGASYIKSDLYKQVGESHALKIRALQLRADILSFYKSLNLKDTEYGVLAALTLGYQEILDDDVVEAFRTTGTVHVLSVSGLHVGLIYAAIAFLLSFLRPTSRFYRLKPLFAMIFLWIYAFVTGLAPSVVRASTMLSVFCTAELFERRSYSIHNLYIAAFFMLLIDPLSLFDIGFQLSFISVLGILYLHPSLSKMLNIKNRGVLKIWQLFTLSVTAQLATFPLCLYYFETFPTYFFLTNLIIVPLVSLIVYSLFGLVFAKTLSVIYMPIMDCVTFVLRLLIQCLTELVFFFKNLPYSLIEDIDLSFFELILTFALVVSLSIFIKTRRTKMLNASIISVLILILNHLVYIL